METLVIYDNTGYILSTEKGNTLREPFGVPFLRELIPEGKRIKATDGIGVDVSVTPHQVILEDIPLSEIEILKQKLHDAEQVAADTSQSQQELLELLLEMGVL